jgi:hypothetical protein
MMSKIIRCLFIAVSVKRLKCFVVVYTVCEIHILEHPLERPLDCVAL